MNETTGVLLLLIAAVVAILARRFRVPYSIGLVVAGMVLSLLPFLPEVALTKELLFGTLLPPLIFEAAFSLPWKELRRDLGVILVLATVGVLLSAVITSAGMHAFANWPWQSAITFGILIAATDPVSVIAMFREAGVRGRLRLLVEAESLFNDGSAAVGFSVALTLATDHRFSALAITSTAVLTIGGGLLCGALVAIVILSLTGRTQDHLVELTFTTVAAYGSFLLAEHFQVSGVLATLTAGLMMRNLGGLGGLSDRGREAVEAFWEYAAFLANSLVFLLIGMHEARQNFVSTWLPALAAIGLVTVGRAAAVYPICALFSRSALRVSRPHQHVLFWGGLRGGLALALALGLPEEMPFRADIITVSFAVVAFSVFAQGLSMTPFLRRLGEIPAAGNAGAHSAG
jgi:CPA1 family monovalent cation:H+ antiporter